MSSRRLAIATALAVLGLAPPAFAKGIEQVEACGAGDCRVSKSIGAAGHSLIPPVSIPEPAPFYRLNVGMGHEGEVFDTIEVLWAPSLGMIAYDEPDAAWVFADAKTRRLAARLTEGLEPFPATKMPVPQATARVDEIVTPASRGGDDGRRRRTAVGLPRGAGRCGPGRDRRAAADQTGTTPWRFHGRSTRFPAAISRARMIVGRVSRGSITSSIMSLRAAM